MPTPSVSPTPSDDTLFWWLFSVTTGVIVIGVIVALSFTFLRQPANPQTPAPLVNYVPPTLPTKTPDTRFDLNPTITTAPKNEIWLFKGYALGALMGNESGNVLMADIVRLPDGRYRMYYGWASDPSHTGIKSAVSQDGISWRVEQGFRLQGASDNNDREAIISGPSVLPLPDGRWRMYYQATQKVEPNYPPYFHIRSAVSTDGLTWTREGIRIDIAPYNSKTGLGLAGHGTFFAAADGTYIGIFSGNMGTNQGPSDLIVATSKDGLSWKNFKRLYPGWHDPIVLKTKNGYVLYATRALTDQGMAVSKDGISWPSQMATITIKGQNGSIATEGNSGVGDIGGIVLPDGTIRLYTNWGSPSLNIAYFEK